MENEELKNLKEENEKLKRTNTAKSEMVSIGAHQIRTSLSALKWIVKMFLDGDLGKLNIEQENLLRKAEDSNERMLAIVSEMLLMNKTEDVVEKEYLFESVDILDVIENSIFDFSGEAKTRNIEIILLKQPEEIPHAKADKEKIRIVIQNLLENSIKYSNDASKIFITVGKTGDDFVEVSIKDTGIGISQLGQTKVFDKFYRDDNAQKKEAVGSGIGLYTSKKIIERHGGKIWFETVEGQGSTFFFTIPIWQN